MKRGSITIFAALSFMLIASFLFALLEAGRAYLLDSYADMCSELALESVCAEYQPGIWEEYQLLCLDGAYGGTEFDMDYVTAVLGARVRRNLKHKGAGARIMEMELDMAEPVSYQLLTDADGAVFLNCISEYMKENLPTEIAQTIYERYKKSQEIENSQQTQGSVEGAQNAIAEAKQQQADAQNAAQGTSQNLGTNVAQGNATEPETVTENPLEVVLALKQNLLLGLVISDVGAISTKQLASVERIEQRSLRKGCVQQVQATDWYDKVLALEYLDSHFSDYLNPATAHALAYEMEYILCGKDTDKGNLEGTVGRLLLVREAANVTHILGDVSKRSAASGMAISLAGFTGNPAIIKVVEIGIVAAWAYVESLLDIRALLAGERIALIKTQAQWMTQLGSLSQALSGGAARNCENGLSYQEYVKGFLFTQNTRKLAYRMMDVMEQNIRLVAAYRNCRMDHMICQIDYNFLYSSEPVFWRLLVLKNQQLLGLQYQNRKNFSYY